MTNLRLETFGALAAAGIGAVGAIVAEPILLGIAAAVAFGATFARINDRSRYAKNEDRRRQRELANCAGAK